MLNASIPRQKKIGYLTNVLTIKLLAFPKDKLMIGILEILSLNRKKVLENILFFNWKRGIVNNNNDINDYFIIVPYKIPSKNCFI